ncbi:uncharacterized protein TNIN_106931 [Trichonephila inaurata madagascariensis]|uniref:Uncharacterized protein n=1 Tax=Trichonephila inaurata madagascariensis TaxID=2747483 RepID=A0A8X6YU53_9ARAC|nr:uncharacterized protein TNIN_106931 [Trichonephila inaurata madagascariensis]
MESAPTRLKVTEYVTHEKNLLHFIEKKEHVVALKIENRTTYKTNWPSRNLKSSERNVPNDPLVNPNDILLLPLHIKLRFMKNFMKSMNKEGKAFQYLRSKFPRFSDVKIKEGIFVGPQIHEIMKDPAFDKVLEGK